MMLAVLVMVVDRINSRANSNCGIVVAVIVVTAAGEEEQYYRKPQKCHVLFDTFM